MVMKQNSVFLLVVVASCCCSLVAASPSPILERLAGIRTKTSPDNQKAAVYGLIDRLFPGRIGDFVLSINESRFDLKHNMDAFEYESSLDSMFCFLFLLFFECFKYMSFQDISLSLRYLQRLKDIYETFITLQKMSLRHS